MRKVRESVAPIWNYFDKSDIVNKRAICNYCKNSFSYKSTITNLKFHIKKKHSEVYEEYCRQKGAPATSISPKYENSNDSDSPELGYFTREDGDKARCDFCDVILTADSATLKRHLSKYHPKLLTSIQGGEGSDSDGDGNTQPQHEEEVYTDFMHLDEEEQNVSASPIKTKRENVRAKAAKKVKKAKLSRLELDRKRLHGSTHNSSDDDEPIANSSNRSKTKTVPEEDQEIEKFTGYVTVLLKTLPKDVCTKLQMDIITLIMKEKMKIQENANATVKVVNLQDLSNISQVPISDVQTIPRNSAVFMLQHTHSNTSETATDLVLNTETTENAKSQAAAPILNKLPDL